MSLNLWNKVKERIYLVDNFLWLRHDEGHKSVRAFHIEEMIFISRACLKGNCTQAVLCLKPVMNSLIQISLLWTMQLLTRGWNIHLSKPDKHCVGFSKRRSNGGLGINCFLRNVSLSLAQSAFRDGGVSLPLRNTFLLWLIWEKQLNRWYFITSCHS